MGAPESRIEGYLVRQCKARKVLCWKFSCPGTSGVPDRFLAKNGRVVLAEAKRPGGHTRPLQDVRLRQLAEAGCEIRVLDSREAVDALLDELDPEEET